MRVRIKKSQKLNVELPTNNGLKKRNHATKGGTKCLDRVRVKQDLPKRYNQAESEGQVSEYGECKVMRFTCEKCLPGCSVRMNG